MIIDFHTHIFPDKIAEGTLRGLADIFGTPPYTDGTYKGIMESQAKAGIDVSVVLPIVTKPSQFASINRFAANFLDGNLISFGSIHPESEDYKSELREIKALGLKGIKLHPDYQEVYFDDIRYKRIVSYASELGLIVVTHAGVDPKCLSNVHCTPRMVAALIKEVEPETLILAHMGGNDLWDEVEACLVGKHVYFDTGVVLGRMPREQLIRMIRRHGAQNVLFGTDSPWAAQEGFASYLKQLPLTPEEQEQILYTNAAKLLALS